MPELPEVETVTHQIRPKILGNKFTNVKFSNKNLRYNNDKTLFNKLLNQEIIEVKRRAKYIQIFFANDQILVLHLGMSGKLLIKTDNVIEKHDHIIAKLTDNSFFIMNDPRRFGMFDVIAKDELANSRYFKDLGPEPFTDQFNPQYLYEICKKSQSDIKTLIMNQRYVVGVGNIYALESLFHSNIHPQTKAKNLTLKQIKLLINNIKIILAKAIEKGGSSIRDYKTIDGSSAYFQHEFYVYGREDEDCRKCKSKIKRIIQNQRSSFYCNKCQQKIN